MIPGPVGEDDQDDATNADWQVNPDPSGFIPVPPHKIIVVCPSALRRRTRFRMGIVRRRAQRMLCPGCGRKAFWEVVTSTSERAAESADFEWS